jgi:predicted TPR repeat methyltransferase
MADPIAAPALGQTAKTAEGASKLYDDWASTYDAALKSWDYPVPVRVSEILTEFNVPTAGNIVDLGCGTGMSGEALRAKGFTGSMTGMDISQASLDLVKSSKPSVYNHLHIGNLDLPLTQLTAPPYDAFISVGVFSYVERFDVLFSQIVEFLSPGGLLVFSHHVAYWDDDRRGCRTAAEALEAEGKWSLVRAGDPEPYMPSNPDPNESKKRIRLVVFRKS